MSFIQNNIQAICDNAVRIREDQVTGEVKPMAYYYSTAFHDAITMLTQLAHADSLGNLKSDVFAPGEIAREAAAAIQLINYYQHLASSIDANLTAKSEDEKAA
ncbi:MAG: hypothetical protein ABNH03_02705 [Alteromonas sp.]|jgi:hypothetical protein|uniref:hypothetical protein n=1 Tax=Alteromonas sp. TaxID=232 RepID=UPI0032D95966